MMESVKDRINRLCEKTQDAYSWDRYNDKGWKGAIRYMIGLGFNDLEIEAVLRSKHMRWAGDNDNRRKYGYCNGNTLREYLEKYPFTKKELNELVYGTFGSLTPEEEE